VSEVTPMMLKAAWNVARQFWPRQVVELRPCKACGQAKGLRVLECSRTLTKPLPGFREAIEAAFAARARSPTKGKGVRYEICQLATPPVLRPSVRTLPEGHGLRD